MANRIQPVEISAIALFTPDDKLVLQRRAFQRLRPGWLSFFGGHKGDHIPDETWREAAWRELAEETTLTRDMLVGGDISHVVEHLMTDEMTGGDGAMLVNIYRGQLNSTPRFMPLLGTTYEIFTRQEALARNDIVTGVEVALRNNYV